jgi:hypothetical protein
MHIIRLRKPWQRNRDGEGPAQRVDVPDKDSAAPRPARSTSYRRNFNRPSGLDPATKVLLRIESWRGDLKLVSINEQSLPIAEPPLVIEITEWLTAHNQLCIQIVDTNATLALLDGEVTLAIDAG